MQQQQQSRNGTEPSRAYTCNLLTQFRSVEEESGGRSARYMLGLTDDMDCNNLPDNKNLKKKEFEKIMTRKFLDSNCRDEERLKHNEKIRLMVVEVEKKVVLGRKMALKLQTEVAEIERTGRLYRASNQSIAFRIGLKNRKLWAMESVIIILIDQVEKIRNLKLPENRRRFVNLNTLRQHQSIVTSLTKLYQLDQ